MFQETLSNSYEIILVYFALHFFANDLYIPHLLIKRCMENLVVKDFFASY